jgi:isoquinoline 1-oxidoreductase subunit beta
VPGYIKSLALDDSSGTASGWVMVYAESFMAASRAADLVKVEWNTPEAGHIFEQDLQRRASDLIADKNGGCLSSTIQA